MKPYTIEKVKTGPLARSFPAYYTELSIQNFTRESIVVITNNNCKYNVPPACPTQLSRECVTIWHRYAVGEPAMHENGTTKQLDGTQFVLQKYELQREGGVFIEELNIVICTQEMAPVVTHPYGTATYDDASAEARKQLIKAMGDAPTFKITANDPLGRYTKLYTSIGDILVTIDVTDVYGDAKLQISTFISGRSESVDIDLSEFLDSEQDILELVDLPITYITTNKYKATHCSKDFKRIPQSEFEKAIKYEIDKQKSMLDRVEENYKLTIADNNKEIGRLKKINDDLKQDNDRVLKQYNALVGQLKATTDLTDITAQTQISGNKVKISDNDVETSNQKRESAEKENKAKTMQLLMAAGLPVAGAIGMKLIEAMIKHYSSNKNIACMAAMLI